MIGLYLFLGLALLFAANSLIDRHENKKAWKQAQARWKAGDELVKQVRSGRLSFPNPDSSCVVCAVYPDKIITHSDVPGYSHRTHTPSRRGIYSTIGMGDIKNWRNQSLNRRKGTREGREKRRTSAKSTSFTSTDSKREQTRLRVLADLFRSDHIDKSTPKPEHHHEHDERQNASGGGRPKQSRRRRRE